MALRNVFGDLALDATLRAVRDLLIAVRDRAAFPLPPEQVTALAPPATQQVSGPLTDAQLRAVRLPTEDSANALRFGGGKQAFAQVISGAGDTLVIPAVAGARIQVLWVAFVPSSDNAAANLVTVRFAAGPTMYVGYAMAHWEAFVGSTQQGVVVSLQTGEPVAVTIHYALI
jgi:hypothetical protein